MHQQAAGVFAAVIWGGACLYANCGLLGAESPNMGEGWGTGWWDVYKRGCVNREGGL